MKKKKFLVIVLILVSILIFGSAALCNTCGTGLGNLLIDISKEKSAKTIDTGSTKNDTNQEINIQDKITDSAITSITESSIDQIGLEKDKQAAENTKLAEEEKVKKQEIAEETFPPGFNDTGDDRFVLSFNTMNPKDDTTLPTYNQVRQYYLDLGIPETNLFTFWGWYSDGGTYENFIDSINEIASKSDQNSIVYINILSHGSEGPPSSMEFANGQGNQHFGPILNYRDISKILDKIKCSRMVVIAHSCAMATSVDPLTENPAYPRVVMAPVTEEEVLLYIMQGTWNVDRNNDGKVSILDIFSFLKDPNDTANPGRYMGLEMIDNFNIADNIFLK